MSTISLVGSDTIKINSRLIVDLCHGEVAKLDFPTEVVTVKTGKNGNAIYAKNESGNQATFELHVLRGSPDDKFLNTIFGQYQQDSARFVLMNAELVKVIGDGSGAVTANTYILTGGVINKAVPATSNVEGDVEQAVSLYSMTFALAPRSIA